ncbi:MAG: penicillin acylase family protein [Woeseiaceae bacterium]|nr:penicillin acylase family protein [Woeseiaceae bacterium]
MKKWLLRGLGLIAAIALITVVAGWVLVRASLPTLDGTIDADGLEGVATIARDDSGIPVITAGSREDLAYATGFAHGQDRYFQMDLIRRRAAGELSELFGDAALDADRSLRWHRFRPLAREILAEQDDADRRVIERYADGVNAGLASLGARPFEYLVLRQTPEPWLPEDSVLVVQAMFMTLNDSRARKDVRRGYAQRVLSDRVYEWMYPEGTEWDAPLMGEARTPPEFPSAEEFRVRDWQGEAPAANEQGRPPLDGSNNWAVSGALTVTGRALVSNDMHLGLTAPNIYYQARLVQTGESPRDVAGVTLPGAPFVIAGSNGNVAWGYTNSYGDWSDAVKVLPGAEQGTYRTPEGDLPFVIHEETIEVAGGEPQVLEIRETIWGPIDEGASYPEAEIAVSWTAHHSRSVNLNILRLETATSVPEAMSIANAMGIPPQNFVTGDADGNIGWTIAGQIPVRSDYDSMVPADWSAAPGWTGWRSPEEYPRVYNPDSGRIWTANSRVADAEALEIIGDGGYDLAARSRQIRENLFAAERFEPEDMLEIQYDDRAVFLTRWRDLLLATLTEPVVADDPDLREYRQLVEDWVPRAAPESVGYRLVRGFRLEVRSRVFHGLTGPVRDEYPEDVDLLISNQFEGPLWQLVNERPLHLLSGEYSSWDELLVSAVRANGDYLTDTYQGPLSDRTWGEYNTATIQHPLSRAMPFLSDWLDMPRDPLNGDSNLPKAQGPGFGASQRFSVSPGDEANAIMHMPTGQSGHPLSPWYRDGHEDWVAGRPSPFLPGLAVHTLTLVPAGGNMAE